MLIDKDMTTSELYSEDLETCLDSVVNLTALRGKAVLITGATGMIGSFMVDALMHGNRNLGLDCVVVAMGRSEEKARRRFEKYWNDEKFVFVQHDVNFPIPEDVPVIDYIVHSASTTHPVAYATEPISTITTNIFGTWNLLNHLCSKSPNARLVLTSSVEIYGQNRGDVEYFDENYCGYIDCNTLRAGYPESKRLSEALCQAYVKEKDVDYVIARLPRTYGSTMLKSDTKALSQFLMKGLNGEDIVLKSEGNQFFSYAYVADAVAAVLTIMLAGSRSVAYNIADEQSDITLKNLAGLVAEISGTNLRFELPDSTEKSGFSTATKAVMNASMLKELGWSPKYSIKTGIMRTLELLKHSI